MDQKTALYIGTFVSIILLVLYFLDRANKGGGATVTPTFEVSTASPEIAQINANKRLAEINSRTQMFGTWTQYLLGIEQSGSAERIVSTQTAGNITIAGIEAETNKLQIDASKILGLAGFDASRFIAQTQSEAERAIAAENAASTRYAAQMNYEATRQQEKSKRTASVGSTIGGIFGSLFKLF